MKQNKLYNGKTEKELLTQAKMRVGFKLKYAWKNITLEQLHSLESVLDSDDFTQEVV